MFGRQGRKPRGRDAVGRDHASVPGKDVGRILPSGEIGMVQILGGRQAVM